MDGIVTISSMKREHMLHVLQIERRSSPDQWTEKDFLHTLRHRRNEGIVASNNGSIIGYSIFGTEPWGVVLVAMAVDARFRRNHVGTKMISHLKAMLGKPGRKKILTEVTDGSLGAHLFLSSCGFIAKKVTHYRDESGISDFYLMEYRFTPIAHLTTNRISRHFDSA